MVMQETLARVLVTHRADVLDDWVAQLAKVGADTRLPQAELRQQASELLSLISAASGQTLDTAAPAWKDVRSALEVLSRDRASRGFTSQDTATFVFSLKRPLFDRLRQTVGDDGITLANATWAATELIDRLGMLTVAAYQKTREEIIARQKEDLLELSTPVVKLWEGIVALPMIGTLDSARTQVVMEALLERIVTTGAETAIIDITGVPTVDTLVAQHLLKTVSAIRLMGAECIISGIRPQIAQTIVHLGLDLQSVTTKANLSDALAVALKRSGLTVSRVDD
jgi:rsbT co-antagonist protein RsbR